MPLQIRRGPVAALSSITPAEGEPLYTTDTKKLYIGDGTTAGGSLIADGTIPLITQAYAVTEGYGLGDFFGTTVGGAANIIVAGPPSSAQTTRAGVLYLQCSATAGEYASLGGFYNSGGNSGRSPVSQWLSSTTLTVVARTPTIATAGADFKAAIGFSDTALYDYNVSLATAIGCYFEADSTNANWRVWFRSYDNSSGFPTFVIFDTGQARNTAWTKFEVVIETGVFSGSSQQRYTFKINGTTVVQKLGINDHAATHDLDMGYAITLTPFATVKSVNASRTLEIDHMSILSEVTR